jgi:ATP-dependent Lhr-like helicase
LDELEKKELIKQVKIIRTDKKKHPLINAPVSKEFFRFLGFYLAEGSWDTSGISIAGEKYLLEFYSKLLKKDFPLEPIVTKNSYGVPVFKFSSILLRGIIEKLLGGLRKKSIKGKFPNILYELPEEYKWCFLSGYLDGDGYPEIKNGKVYSLGFVTFNQNFANGLRSLLLQLGIVASIRKRRYEKEQDFRGRKIRKSGICYTISIYGGNHLRNFSKFIQPKRKSLQFAFNSLRKTDGYCNRDVIPNIGELLKVVRKRVGLSTYELQKIGYNPEKVEIGSRNITRKNLQQLIELYSKFSEVPELLKNLANSDIFWDKITKIEKVYIDKIYSLVNTTNHNYVINGFICQNSSTSLELGIDIGYIDLVAQIGSPKSVTRAVQRIGRSGHGFYDTAVGRIIVLDRDDLVECSVMLKAAKERLLDRFDVVKNALDILAQHVVGMALNKKWKVEEALKVIRRSYCYHELDKKQFIQLLHYLAGHYASLEDRAVYGKIWFDEKDGVFGRRGKYTRIIYFLNLGAIPDEVSIDVYTYDGWYVGNIEEDFLARLRKGDIFILGGKPYRFRFARGLRCYVDPMPHETNPTIPNWFSELLPLSYDLALEIQKFREKMKEFLIKKVERKKVVEWLLKNLPIDENSANSIYSYFLEQWFYVHEIPGREILVEKTFDLEGRKYVVFHSLFGRRINDALSRAVAILASDRIKANVGVSVSDNGFALLIPREKDLDIEKLFKELVNCNLIELLENNIRRTELMKRRFRHCASRSFLVLRNYKGYKISVAKQQRNSEILLRVCEKISKDFPVIKETYREILNDTMDLKRTEEIISKLKNGKLKYKVIETELPSPFAHGLIVLGEADIITMKDRKKRLLELYEATMKRILKAE